MIALTPSAVAVLRRVIAEQEGGVAGVRLGAASAGCAGLRYTMRLAAAADAGEEACDCDGVRLFVDRASVKLLAGTVVDFVEGPDEPGFVFDNPNAVGCHVCTHPAC